MKNNLEPKEQNKDINNIILDKLQELSQLIKRNEDNTKKELNSLKNDFNNELNQLKNRISNLENSKSNLNNKQEIEDVNIINNTSNIKFHDIKNDNSIINYNNIEESQINSASKNKTKKKRGNYKKKNEMSSFYKGIRHLVIKEENKLWKCSIGCCDNKNNTSYYYCSDTKCSGRGLVRFDVNEKTEYDKKEKDLENFILTKEHSFPYEEHSYQKYKTIKKEIEELPKKEIINKLKDYKYLCNFTKAFAILHKDRITSALSIINLLKEIYGDVKLNKKSTSTEILEKLKTSSQIDNINKIDDNTILKNVCYGAFIYLRNYREFTRKSF